jgi:hypothetical protein
MSISDPAVSGMTEWRNALTTNTYDITRFESRAKVLHFNVISTCAFSQKMLKLRMTEGRDSLAALFIK